MDRRDFIKTSVVAGAYAVLGRPRVASAEDPTPWFDRPMRWAQLVLVENDPGQFDPDFWLDYFKRIHADSQNEDGSDRPYRPARGVERRL